MKFLFRFTATILVLYCGLNYAWVHAASVAAISTSCDEELLSQSKSAVAKLYGSTKSHPIIRCVDSPSLGLHVGYGRTNFAPALPPVVLIGPQGVNVDVIAHELAHAELIERLGFIQRELSIPTWLDEGLAMQVDHRKQYNFAALKEFHDRSDLVTPPIASMNSANFFVAGDQGMYNYAYSKCLVGHWVSHNDNWLEQLKTIGDELPPALLAKADLCD